MVQCRCLAHHSHELRAATERSVCRTAWATGGSHSIMPLKSKFLLCCTGTWSSPTIGTEAASRPFALMVWKHRNILPVLQVPSALDWHSEHENILL
jgi:hypothetical protein